jgi:hypothetical protein
MTVGPTTAAARMRTRPPAVGGVIGALTTLVMLAGCSSLPTSSASTSHPPSSSSSTSSTSSSTSSTTAAPLPLPLPRAGLGLVKPIVPSASAYFGAWRGPGPGRPSRPETSIKVAEDAIGRKYAIDHRYYGWGAVIPTAYESWTVSHGRIPMVSLCACRFADGSVVPWARIAAGKEDAYLDTIAKGFVALNTPAFFLFDAEPETNVGIRGTAADYRAAFRHVVTVFRTAGAKNVAFVWATTAYAFRPESGDSALTASLYPGDGVVDWVASDPYNFANGGDWNSLSYEVDPWYQWVTATHPDKPLMLSEWGSKEDPAQPTRKAAWFRSALTALETKYPKIRAVVYFDEEKAEHGTVNDWRIDTSASSLTAFAEIAHAAWFRAHE